MDYVSFPIQMVPDLLWFNLWFWLYDGAKAIDIQSKLYFEFWPFPRPVICDTVFSCDAGQQQQAPALRQLHNPKGTLPLGFIYCHSVPIQPFCSSLSVHQSTNYMKYSILYYKTDCVRWFCPTLGKYKCSEHV